MKGLQTPRTPAPSRTEPAVTAEVLEEDRAFAALEEEWDDLYEHSPNPTPFQSWGWLYTWWEHYGAGRDLRLVAVREAREGLLVGVAPLMLDRRSPLGRLLLIGNGAYSAPYSSYLDVVARGGWEEEVAPAVAGAMRGMGGWAVADLQELGPGAEAWRLVGAWGGSKARIWQGYCTWVEALPWEELLRGLKKGYRSTARRALRDAEAGGTRWEPASAGAVEEAARRLAALNREQWRERWRETGPEHWSPRFERHLMVAARRMSERGLGGVHELRRGEEVLISTFRLFGRDCVGLYMVGAGEEAHRLPSYNALFVRDMVEQARDRGLPFVNLFRGEDPYKLRWNPQIVDNHRAVLGKDLAALALYAGYLRLRTGAVRYAKSGEAPDWVGGLPARYRRLRYAAARLARSERLPRRLREAVAPWFEGV